MTKRICFLGVLTALCLVLSYLESLVSLSFIAPGIKLGLANTAALLLLYKKDYLGALAVNTVRILLSALLFGSVMSLWFSLAGGLASFGVMLLLAKCGRISPVGFSIAGGTVHNAAQAAVAAFTLGRAVLYYLPVLLLCGALSGALIGFLGKLLNRRLPQKLFVPGRWKIF